MLSQQTITGHLQLPAEGHEQDRAQWLPKQTGHTALTFSNGLSMAHNETSAALDKYAKGNRPEGTYAAPDGLTVKTAELSDRSLIALLSGKGGAPSKHQGQPLRFSNGTAATHSDDSRACQAYYNAVVGGRKTVPGLVCKFEWDGGQVDGPQKQAKLKKLMGIS
jgi:hypothetical protein